MESPTMERRGVEWLDAHASEWVDAGLLTESQADAIRDYEHLDEVAAPTRLTHVAEVAAYVGTVLALMGGAAAVGESWDRLGLVGKLALAITLAVVGLASGTWMVRLGEPGTIRLGSFLWAVGTGGVAMAAAVVIDEFDPAQGGWIAVAAGLSALGVGLALWRNLDRPLQLLSAVVGLAVAFAGLGNILDVAPWVGGVIMLVLGIALAAFALTGFVHPREFAAMVGSIAAIAGGFMIGDVNEHIGPAIALVVATGVIVTSVRERLVPLLAIGVGGALIATEALLATTFTGALSSLMVSVLGLVLIAVVILNVRRPA